MLATCAYRCSPELALSWPQGFLSAGFIVIDVRETLESNGVRGHAGMVCWGSAKVNVCVGPGWPAVGGPLAKDKCHILVAYRAIPLIHRYMRNYRLAVAVEKELLELGAQLFSPKMRLAPG